MIQYNTEAQPFLCRTGTFSWTARFQTVPRFYLDVLDGDQVLQDLEGIDFADCERPRCARDHAEPRCVGANVHHPGQPRRDGRDGAVQEHPAWKAEGLILRLSMDAFTFHGCIYKNGAPARTRKRGYKIAPRNDFHGATLPLGY